MHDICSLIPGTKFPSSSTAGDEKDKEEDQRSYQEDGEDHQKEHIAVFLLLGLEWDLLKYTEEDKEIRDGELDR